MEFHKLLTGLVMLTGLSVSAQVSVLTNRNDNARSAWNASETVLDASNVNPAQFGLIYKLDVDDQVYAQPLVLSPATVNGVWHNSVVLVATVNNSVYAFDAEDSLHSGVPLWHVNLTGPNSRPPNVREIQPEDCGYSPSDPYSYTDFSYNIGIVGTPVVDDATGVLYVVSRDVDTTQAPCRFAQWLNAIDVSTGGLLNSVYISAYYPGVGDGAVDDTVWFDPLRELQRPGLLLLDGTVYITWAGHCDWNPYHGWVLGYDATTMEQTVRWCASPDGERAGIWMSACGPTVDGGGDIWLTTGNGTIGSYSPAAGSGDVNWYRNRGESVVRLRRSGDTLETVDWFTPPRCRLSLMENNDLDYGISGVLMVPGTNLVLSGSKEGIVYVNDVSDLGGCDTLNCDIADVDGLVQALQPNRDISVPLIYGTPLYYRYDAAGGDSEFVYMWVRKDSMTQYPLDRSTMTFDTLAAKKSPQARFYPSIMSLSSNGTAPGTGVLWCSHLRSPSESANAQTYPGDSLNGVARYHAGRLEAYDPRDVSRLLWHSDMDPRDSVGNYAKFNTPTVANGRVYLATASGTVNVYGVFGWSVSLPQSADPAPALSVYPNPAGETVSLRCSASMTATVYDATGRAVLTVALVRDLPAELSLDGIAPGAYVVRAGASAARLVKLR